MSSEHARAFAEAERLQVSVPEELQAYRQFVGWELFERSGKPTKVPINPHTGYYAKVTDPQTFGSFREALAMLKNGRAKGIGFVFTEDDPFVGTDLDHCITDDGSS